MPAGAFTQLSQQGVDGKRLALPYTKLQALGAVVTAGVLRSFGVQDVGTVPAQLTQHVHQPAGNSASTNTRMPPALSTRLGR